MIRILLIALSGAGLSVAVVFDALPELALWAVVPLLGWLCHELLDYGWTQRACKVEDPYHDA